MDESICDSDLLARARTDPDAFRIVYERHAVAMRNYIRRRVGDPDAANDLLAETFAQAWRSRRRFRDPGDGSCQRWLYGIAQNLLRHYERTRAVQTRARQKLGIALDTPDGADATDERLDAAALGPVLNAAVDQLPDDQQDAIRLRVLGELQYDEVADRLGCTNDSARRKVSRALRTLQTKLEGVHP
jgi:RNA polymerase sigma-70 factor (ECF subfamily)